MLVSGSSEIEDIRTHVRGKHLSGDRRQHMTSIPPPTTNVQAVSAHSPRHREMISLQMLNEYLVSKIFLYAFV